ncbi:MAG: MBL fold metallo-hydrolase, partial [Myxococcota bacterium]
KRFPKATVYASSDDLNLADHVRRISSALPRLRMRLFGRPERPQRMRTVLPGERITIGSLVFDSLPLPGVTAGSLAYRYDRFVFVGDSLWPTEQGLEPPSGLWLERASELRHSLSRLESWEGDWIATSRGGFSEMPASWSP